MGCARCGIPRQEMDAVYALEVVTRMLDVLLKKTDLKGKTGGAFCIIDQETMQNVVPPTLVGTVPEEKKEKYLELCAEKANRLCAMHVAKDHWLSWESRDPDANQWGGAIHDGEYSWAFSGLTEEGDEALMLISAHMCGRIVNGAPKIYAETSGNPIIMEGDYLFWKTRDI